MDQTPVAEELRVVVAQLVRRFRQDRQIPQPQFNVLSALMRRGASTTSQLAALEGVRPQSMAHTVTQLLDAGLVERNADPSDGRQMLIEISAAGRSSMVDFRRTADAWVDDAIASRLTEEERRTLRDGIALMARLVDE
jgi:DNA-binding MarR family transcriptional regulator